MRKNHLIDSQLLKLILETVNCICLKVYSYVFLTIKLAVGQQCPSVCPPVHHTPVRQNGEIYRIMQTTPRHLGYYSQGTLVL